MVKVTLSVDGMMCGMCESHINDCVRKCADVKKVSSSHSKNETVIIAEDDLDVEAVLAAISAQGYKACLVSKAPYEKKGFFSFLRK